MKINAVKIVCVESSYKSSASKYEKSNSNINISKISHLPFDMFCFHLKRNDTVPNEPIINKFLETTSASKLRECHDNIIMKKSKKCVFISMTYLKS